MCFKRGGKMGKIAFMFAGQGAQTPGMGKDLYNNFKSARTIFDMAGETVKDLSFNGPSEELNRTLNAQPCLFAMDLACAEALNENGIKPSGVAGFSLGEIPACAYCGIMGLEQAFEFVNYRARVMDECASINKGEMYACLKLDAISVKEICNKLSHAYPVNFNCDSQTVVACSDTVSESLKKEVSLQGGKAVKLAVSGAFHSPFMDTASDKILNYIKDKEFGKMEIPLYSNVTSVVYGDPRVLLAKQVNSPVLWQKTIENMVSDGFDIFIEVGAGKTLSGFIKKINPNVTALNVCDSASLEETLKFIKAV